MSDVMERLNADLEGRYRLDRELGQGGMATVYQAFDIRHERQVALKVLKPELAAVIGADRFLAEIRTTANLQHPRILPLFDSGTTSGYLYYVMPLVEGASWANPNEWRPEFAGTQVTYGTPAGSGGYGPYAASITLVQTPEPGSLILLMTGLSGVILGSVRRRKGKRCQSL